MQTRPQLYRKKPDKEIRKKLATTVEYAYPHIKKFRNTIPDLDFEFDFDNIINTQIELGFDPYTWYPFKYMEKWKQIEEEILHGPKPKSNIEKLKGRDRTRENELIDYWEFTDRGDVFWDRKKDGRHIEPAQEGEIYNFGEERSIPAHEILDDDYGENKEKNDTIFKNREIYRSGKKGRGSYENLGYYGYKSAYHRELFFEIVEAVGFVNKAEVKQPRKEIYDSVDGVYHKVSLSTRKIKSITHEVGVNSDLLEEDEF